MGARLYMIATPLGNRGDITLRAIETLKTLEVLFAEDTREAVKLLELCGLSASGKRVQSYAAHNMKGSTEKALECLRRGESIGFLSDRGTPAVSDPGALLAREARALGFEVIPIPGPSAVTALFSVAGLEDGRFLFVGFPPTGASDRQQWWDRIEQAGVPACLYESPQRIRATVAELKARFPEGVIFFGREITKSFESFGWHRLADVDSEGFVEKGEYSLFVRPGKKAVVGEPWREEVTARLASEKQWAKSVADRHGVSAKEVYNALQERKRENP